MGQQVSSEAYSALHVSTTSYLLTPQRADWDDWMGMRWGGMDCVHLWLCMRTQPSREATTARRRKGRAGEAREMSWRDRNDDARERCVCAKGRNRKPICEMTCVCNSRNSAQWHLVNLCTCFCVMEGWTLHIWDDDDDNLCMCVKGVVGDMWISKN